jgi:hypothetical protein
MFVLALSVGLTIATGPTAGVPRANGGVHALTAPLGWLASSLMALVPAPRPLINSGLLTRERGSCGLTLEVDDHGSALFLELSGRCRFTSAAIEYADGACDSLDLRRAKRGSGLYLLHEFEEDRRVRRVTLALEALSSRAYVGARLMR